MYPSDTKYLSHTALEAIMKVALIGASGNGGSRLLAELSRRGHQVTAIARNPETVAKLPGVTAKKGDVFDKPGLVAAAQGPRRRDQFGSFLRERSQASDRGGKEAGVKRYFVVGGAGSLEVAPGVKLIDTPQFPAEYKVEAAKAANSLSSCARTRIWTGPSCRRLR